jgi:hypothetical protein
MNGNAMATATLRGNAYTYRRCHRCQASDARRCRDAGGHEFTRRVRRPQPHSTTCAVETSSKITNRRQAPFEPNRGGGGSLAAERTCLAIVLAASSGRRPYLRRGLVVVEIKS